MTQTHKCPECGSDNPSGARFCGGCGHALDEVRCDVCGMVNSFEFKFCTGCGNSLGERQGEDDGRELKVAAAQRRLLTILFCDLVNSTGITEALDPERMRGVIRSFQETCAEVIGEYGGRVTEYLGDGVVVQFTGHENSAERAVRSALEITRRVSEIEVVGAGLENDRLAVRSGLASGLAIVGDKVGKGARQIESSVGVPPNLAKRIEGLAQPNEVVISDETHSLVSGLFRCRDIGWHRLKGFKEPHRIWRVLGEENVDFRFGVARGEIAPLVNRHEVMETIMRRWAEASRGSGQVVFLSGEPGIGKSRIVEEVDRRLADTPHVQLRYQCSPYHTNTALYPVIARVSRAAGFQPGDTPEVRFGKLVHFLRETYEDLDRSVPLYARLLSLPSDEPYPPLELPPAELKQKTLQMLADRALEISATTPLLIQVEDVQWFDPTSLEMFLNLVQVARGHAILVLATARPEFTADFIHLPHVSALTINRLSEAYTRELVEQTWVSLSLPKGYLQEIVARSEGIPLFAEELTKTLIESLRRDEEPSIDRLGIPATLQDSLLARLDHLPGSARTAAQVAAAIGREFSLDVLGAAIGVGKEKMQRRIDELLRAEVVYRHVSAGQETLVFKHALMQDAAYESLLQSDRREIHRRIAAAVEERFPAIGEANPGVLARHWGEAGEAEKALPYCLSAGRQASERFANIEAAGHLNRGLKLLGELPEGESRDQRELELRVVLGTVLRVSEGAGAEITRANFDLAVALCDRLPESPEQFAALWGKWQNAMNFKRELGLEWTDRLLALAEKLDDPGFMVQAHHAQWTTLFHVGRFADAHRHIEQGLALYDEQAHAHHAALYGGHDPRICGGGFAAHTFWMLGYPDQSLEYAEKCVSWGRKLSHTGSSLHVIELNLLLYQFRWEPERLAPWIEELERVCAENALPEYEGKLNFNRGWLLASRGEIEAGIDLMREGLENQRAVGSLEDIPMFSEKLAKVLADAGRTESGLDYLEQALNVAESHSLRYWLAEVRRRKGELLQSAGRKEAAGKCFEEALKVAQRQKAKSLELRAAMSIARRFAENDKPAEGLGILRPVYDWFTEGLDSHDLKVAYALLQKLESALK